MRQLFTEGFYFRIGIVLLVQIKSFNFYANRVVPDETPRSVASDLRPHGLPTYFYGKFSLMYNTL